MSRRPKIYLAGPIAGLTFDDAQDWREDVRAMLAPEIDAYSPLRQKHFLRKHGVIEQTAYTNPMATDRGIMTRDHWDCQTSDLILCNLLDTKRVTIGSVMEIAWAYAYRKPLIVVMEPSGNLHDHPMVRDAIGYRVPTLDAAVAVARAILLPHTEEN
jgi:nucleoside 2-deoxyribosyltransferase